jgi:HEAT repeat protein
LAKAKGPCGLILISDGKETCRGNPTAEVAKLAATFDLSFGVNVIGFDVETDEREALQEIAGAGKGKYYDAANAADFRKAVVAIHRELPKAAPAPVVLKVTPAVQILIDRLENPDSQVRRSAAENLGKLHSRSSIPALIKVLKDESPHVRIAATNALAGWSDESVVNALAERVADERGFDVGQGDFRDKDVALQALRKVGPHRVTGALAKLLKSGNYHSMRNIYGAEMLSKYGDESAADALVERVADERGFDVGQRDFRDKEAALKALRLLGPGRVAEALTKAMKSKDLRISEWATSQFTKLNDEK